MIVENNRLAGSNFPEQSNYELFENDSLGSSPHATVYKGYDFRMRRDVAIKVLAESTPNLLTLLAGAWQCARIPHANIAQIYDVDETKRWIVMERFGRSLADEQRKKTVTSEQLTTALEEVLRALVHIHAEEKLHHAVHGANIFLTSTGVKLADGRGLNYDDEMPLPTTPGQFVAPEILNAAAFGRPGQHSDLFCLGLTFARVLLGAKRFKQFSNTNTGLFGAKSAGLLWISESNEFKDLRSLLPEQDELLATVLNRMLNKRVVDRYQTAEQVLSDLTEPTSRFHDGQSKSAVVTTVHESDEDPPSKTLEPNGGNVVILPASGSGVGGRSQPQARNWRIDFEEIVERAKEPKIASAIGLCLMLLAGLAFLPSVRSPVGASELHKDEDTQIVPRELTPMIVVVNHADAELGFDEPTEFDFVPSSDGIDGLSQFEIVPKPSTGIGNTDFERIETLREQLDGVGITAKAHNHHAGYVKLDKRSHDYSIELVPKQYARILVKSNDEFLADANVHFSSEAGTASVKSDDAGVFTHEVAKDFREGTVIVSHDEYRSEHKQVTLEDVEDFMVVELTKKRPAAPPVVEERYTYYITSDPIDARVWIDGREIASTTPAEVSLTAGQHLFELKKDGFHGWRKTLSVNDEENYKAILQPIRNTRPPYTVVRR